MSSGAARRQISGEVAGSAASDAPLTGTVLPALDSPDAPKYWMNETSGRLAVAIRAYLDNPDGMMLREVAFMRAYLRQWIVSPAWDANPSHDDRSRAELEALRVNVGRICTAADIKIWLHDARMAGIDPL